MKTLKMMFVAVFVTLTMVSFAQISNQKPLPVREDGRFSVCIILNNVSEFPELVRAIYNQVDPGFLNFEHQGLYTFKVIIKRTTYMVSGRFEEWEKFFRIRPTHRVDGNRIIE